MNPLKSVSTIHTTTDNLLVQARKNLKGAMKPGNVMRKHEMRIAVENIENILSLAKELQEAIA